MTFRNDGWWALFVRSIKYYEVGWLNDLPSDRQACVCAACLARCRAVCAAGPTLESFVKWHKRQHVTVYNIIIWRWRTTTFRTLSNQSRKKRKLWVHIEVHRWHCGAVEVENYFECATSACSAVFVRFLRSGDQEKWASFSLWSLN